MKAVRLSVCLFALQFPSRITENNDDDIITNLSDCFLTFFFEQPTTIKGGGGFLFLFSFLTKHRNESCPPVVCGLCRAFHCGACLFVLDFVLHSCFVGFVRNANSLKNKIYRSHSCCYFNGRLHGSEYYAKNVLGELSLH